jgi:ATP-binding cassette subfamily F protein 3
VELFRASGLECHYGAREIFSDVSLVLNDADRVGLVGRNGAGKSSLLRLLAGVEQPSAGSIVRAKDTRFGYLAQSAADETQATLQELVDGALARVTDLEWPLQNKRLRTMLDAFGFGADDFVRPLREFSGGQRAKAALAHLLIDDPDYLILDEPTNHLDITTVRWLESHIAADKRAYIIVSHDRYFLDRVATRMWEIDLARFFAYAPERPAYTQYVRQRNLRTQLEREAYEEYVTERDKRRSTIAGLRATHTSSDYSQVRSREKQLARLESASVAPAPAKDPRRIGVRLRSARRATTGFAFEAKDLAKSYAQALFGGVSFDLQQGHRLAIVGPNGSGKSTLLKILAEQLLPDTGDVRYNPAVRAAYFTQNAQEQLNLDATAVDAVLEAGTVSDEEARSLLGRMLISGDAADKIVRSFSGGERRRIMLARLMSLHADLLLLDEPTNDLDIDSREALESVLDDYAGAIVLVSHDRYLLDRLCDRVLWIEGGAWGLLEGGYTAYETLQRERDRARRERDGKARGKAAGASRLTPLKIRSQLETKVARLERDIAKRDARKAEIEALFATTELYEDRARVKALQAESDEIVSRNGAALLEWEGAHEELLGLDSGDSSADAPASLT